MCLLAQSKRKERQSQRSHEYIYKGEKMIENVDGTKMIKRVLNVEKTGFCDVGCGGGL